MENKELEKEMNAEVMEKEKEQEIPVLSFMTESAASKEELVETKINPEDLPKEKLEIDDSILTDADKQAVEGFVSQIDLNNTQGILEYGTGVQKKMADFSQSTLETVRTKDLGEVGDLLGNVVTEVKNFDDDDEKGFFGFFKKAGHKIESMKVKYDKTEANISKICTNLEGHQVTLLKDVAMLDQMYDLNLGYYKEITMYIIAGKKRLDQVRATELQDLKTKAEASGKTEDAQAVRDLEEKCVRFEKKLYDLDLTRTISMQTAPQIRLIQSNDTQMAEKIQSVVVNTIPLWKNQMVIALGLEHSQQAMAAEKAVTDATNELLKKNAENLKVASVETAKANERGIVDIETLKQTNASLITTLDEVRKIQTEGRAKRELAEQELRQMEGQLRDKLLEMSK